MEVGKVVGSSQSEWSRRSKREELNKFLKVVNSNLRHGKSTLKRSIIGMSCGKESGVEVEERKRDVERGENLSVFIGC